VGPVLRYLSLVFFLERAMRPTTLAAVAVAAIISPPQAPPVAMPNDNRAAAGTLRDGVLDVSLEAKPAMWHLDGDSLPGLQVEAFAEPGRPPSAPGPLIRVPQGTTIRARIRNTLERDTLTFVVPANLAGPERTGLDSVVVPAGETRELTVLAARPGNYAYRALGRSAMDRALRIRGLLGGAIVVDSGPPVPDRIFVLMGSVDRITSSGVPDRTREVLGINGRSWPHTERIRARMGDTLRWRLINVSSAVHPMHLHGFYYTVESFDGPVATPAQKAGGRLAVTERMTPFTTMTMSWVPERPGNWLFHCHFQDHASPHRPLGAEGRRAAPHANHAETGMGGVVMGVEVAPRGSGGAMADEGPQRRIRLVAVRDAGFPDSLPSLRFVPEENGRPLPDARAGSSPPLELLRGRPVSIMVVNRLGEPLSVHWHGIELESYYDGVAGFAGLGRRLAPLIAPGDSFEARMTPPRSGTFLYHSHVDEPRHHRAGLVGALIVRDAPLADPSTERVFILKSGRGSAGDDVREVNGQANPDTVVLRIGRTYRFRIANLSIGTPNATVSLTARPDEGFLTGRDTMLVRWRPVAKDGADLPPAARPVVPAVQVVSIGETYDFEVEPAAPGALRLEVVAPALRAVTVRVPIRVER
jgi:FtsP/CotA-like multicopper oxidase with cupredoxin domain